MAKPHRYSEKAGVHRSKDARPLKLYRFRSFASFLTRRGASYSVSFRMLFFRICDIVQGNMEKICDVSNNFHIVRFIGHVAV